MQAAGSSNLNLIKTRPASHMRLFWRLKMSQQVEMPIALFKSNDHKEPLRERAVFLLSPSSCLPGDDRPKKLKCPTDVKIALAWTKMKHAASAKLDRNPSRIAGPAPTPEKREIYCFFIPFPAPSGGRGAEGVHFPA